MIAFRSLCAKLRTTIKALPRDRQEALGDGLPRLIANGSSYSYRINANDFLKLCARLGIDPLSGQPCPPVSDPGELCLASVGAGCAIRRTLCKHTMRSAAEEIGVSAATLSRLEQNLPVSIDSVRAVCAFIGVHPFAYMQRERKAA